MVCRNRLEIHLEFSAAGNGVENEAGATIVCHVEVLFLAVYDDDVIGKEEESKAK